MHTYTVKLTYKVASLVDVKASGPKEALKKALELRESENYEYLYGVEIFDVKPSKMGKRPRVGGRPNQQLGESDG